MEIFDVGSVENDFIDVFDDLEMVVIIARTHLSQPKDCSSVGVYIFSICIVSIRHVDSWSAAPRISVCTIKIFEHWSITSVTLDVGIKCHYWRQKVFIVIF